MTLNSNNAVAILSKDLAEAYSKEFEALGISIKTADDIPKIALALSFSLKKGLRKEERNQR